MEQLPSGGVGREVGEKVSIKGAVCGKYRVFAAFIICVAILTAAFAASSIWRTTESGQAFFDRVAGFFGAKENASDPPPTNENTTPAVPQTTVPPIVDEPIRIPEGATPVLPLDLSYLSRGEGYLLNETAYTPDVSSLLSAGVDLRGDGEVSANAPLVLIVHTHTAESYDRAQKGYVEGDLSSATYSANAKENMIAVGKVLAERLNEGGIPTLQCTVNHMGEGMTLQGSYDRAADSVRAYLDQYPSIRLVIDLHRDAVMTEAGEYVQTALPDGDGTLAQVMPVIGTDSNGTEHPRWESNLALALALRRKMNLDNNGICRPVYLRNSSFHQELAPYSLLLEIGTGANSLEQAKRTALKVGDALVSIFETI